MGAKYLNLQALRGVACLLLVAYHVAEMETWIGLGRNPLKPLRWFGYAGVDLFFVLSGFIIATTACRDLGRPRALPGYLFRRLWRVYPTYWAALAGTFVTTATAAYLVCGLGPGIFAASPAEVLGTLLLVPESGWGMIPANWTLSYEVMFYTAYAGLFLVPRRAAGPALAAWAVGVAWAAVAGFVPANRFAALAASPFVLEFLAGCLVAAVPATLSRRAAAGVLAAATAWAVAGSAALFHPDPHWIENRPPLRVAVFGPAAALVVFALAGRERAGGRIGGPRLVAIGEASYSIYLTHGCSLAVVWIASCWSGWTHSRLTHLVWLAGTFAACVLPALLFHRWVERPLMNLARRRTPTPAPAIPAAIRRAA